MFTTLIVTDIELHSIDSIEFLKVREQQAITAQAIWNNIILF